MFRIPFTAMACDCEVVLDGVDEATARAAAAEAAAEVQRMEKAIQQVLQMPDVKEVMSQRLMVTPLFRNSAQMDTLQREELAHWEPIIAASGFKPD